MKDKTLIILTILIASLAVFCIFNENADAETEDDNQIMDEIPVGTEYEIKIFGPGNDFDSDYTKLSLKAGPLKFEFIEPQYVYSTYLCIGDEEYYIGDEIYIPYDCENAYLMSYSDINTTIKCKITNIPETDTYSHVGEFYAYSYEWPNTELELEPGKYTFKFSRNGSLEKSSNGTAVDSFEAGKSKEVTIDKKGKYRFTNNHGWSPYPLLTYYSMSPDKELNYIDEDIEMEKNTGSTTLGWYLFTVNVSAGNHYIGSDGNNYVFVDEESAKKFEREIIDKSITSIPYEYYPNVYDFKSESGGKVWIYTLCNVIDLYEPTFYIDGSYAGTGKKLTENTEKAFYLTANTNAKIAVDYDSSKYMMYLVDTKGDKVLLLDEVLIDITTSIAKEYYIMAAPIITNSEDCFQIEYELYTEGIPESDGYGAVFGVLAIGLCAVFFGLLLYSGIKPKW